MESLNETMEEINKCLTSNSKILEIGYNRNITIFPEEIRQLTWLTKLRVACTSIRTLPDWIGELVNLKELDISGNHKIKKLPSSLGNLRYLKTLILDDTGIKKIPAFIGKIHSLGLLYISIYGIEEVPQCILDLPKLQRIETGGYRIEHLPALVTKQLELNKKEFLRRIERCKKYLYRKLNLSFLYIGELPVELLDLQHLEKLNLSCNNLKELPEWIGNFPNLTSLYLDSNELTTLSNSIGKLKNLKHIDLSLNRLKTLPETFGSLSSLESFTLYEKHNYPFLEKEWGQGAWFTQLPESFGNLSNLVSFTISDTKITRLPESFGNLKSLKELHIQEILVKDFYFPPSMKNLRALRVVTFSALDHVPDFIGELTSVCL